MHNRYITYESKRTAYKQLPTSIQSAIRHSCVPTEL